jgi:hypothetical protein
LVAASEDALIVMTNELPPEIDANIYVIERIRANVPEQVPYGIPIGVWFKNTVTFTTSDPPLKISYALSLLTRCKDRSDKTTQSGKDHPRQGI